MMERLVHVVPLGWEADRAILPIRAMKAHKAYLLTNPESHPKSRHFLNIVRGALEEKEIEVVHVSVDSHSDLKGLVREIGLIVRAEVDAGNHVYINASACGKIAAIAATLSGMAHLDRRGHVYYSRPEDYLQTKDEHMRHGLTRGMRDDPVHIPLFKMALPAEVGGLILTKLAQKTKPKEATYLELFDWLFEAGVDGFPSIDRQTSRKEKGRVTVKLTNTILRPLREADYVRVRREGKRAIVKLTDAGDYMAHLIAGW